MLMNWSEIENLLIELVKRSVDISVIIGVVMAARLLMKKLPKRYSCVLWGIVGVRMIFDFHLPSRLSLFNAVSTKEASDSILGVASYYSGASELAGEGAGSWEPKIIESNFTKTITLIWLIGCIGLLLYGVISYISLKRKLSCAIKIENNVYECDKVSSPFVLGIIKPRIYIPIGMTQTERRYILLHEKSHIERLDYITKIIAFVLLAVYWFNPVVWIAYLFFVKDQEMSCDENVLMHFGYDAKQIYSSLMLEFATDRETSSVFSLAFGESCISKRIKNVLKYKSIGTRMSEVVGIFLVVLAISCLTSAGTIFGGNVGEVVVKEWNSKIYSEEEVREAIMVTEEYFGENFSGCTLTEITYAGDDSIQNHMDILNWNEGDEVIVLTSSFDVDSSGGDGSLNANSTYEGFEWLLVREKGGKWRHVDHGYG